MTTVWIVWLIILGVLASAALYIKWRYGKYWVRCRLAIGASGHQVMWIYIYYWFDQKFLVAGDDMDSIRLDGGKPRKYGEGRKFNGGVTIDENNADELIVAHLAYAHAMCKDYNRYRKHPTKVDSSAYEIRKLERKVGIK